METASANFARWSGYPVVPGIGKPPPATPFDNLEAPNVDNPTIAEDLCPFASADKPVDSFDSSGLFGVSGRRRR